MSEQVLRVTDGSSVGVGNGNRGVTSRGVGGTGRGGISLRRTRRRRDLEGMGCDMNGFLQRPPPPPQRILLQVIVAVRTLARSAASRGGPPVLFALAVPSQIELIQIMVVKVTRGLDVVVVLALHVVGARVYDRVEPLGHEVVDVAAGFPVTLIAVVGPENDEEGSAGDEDSNAVGVSQFQSCLIPVPVEESVNDDRDEACDSASKDGGAVYLEDEACAQKRFSVGNHVRVQVVSVSPGEEMEF